MLQYLDVDRRRHILYLISGKGYRILDHCVISKIEPTDLNQCIMKIYYVWYSDFLRKIACRLHLGSRPQGWERLIRPLWNTLCGWKVVALSPSIMVWQYKLGLGRSIMNIVSDHGTADLKVTTVRKRCRSAILHWFHECLKWPSSVVGRANLFFYFIFRIQCRTERSISG